MHVWARWQHQEADATLKVCSEQEGSCFGSNRVSGFHNQKLNFDNWDLFQVGGIIFF